MPGTHVSSSEGQRRPCCSSWGCRPHPRSWTPPPSTSAFAALQNPPWCVARVPNLPCLLTPSSPWTDHLATGLAHGVRGRVPRRRRHAHTCHGRSRGRRHQPRPRPLPHLPPATRCAVSPARPPAAPCAQPLRPRIVFCVCSTRILVRPALHAVAGIAGAAWATAIAQYTAAAASLVLLLRPSSRLRAAAANAAPANAAPQDPASRDHVSGDGMAMAKTIAGAAGALLVRSGSILA